MFRKFCKKRKRRKQLTKDQTKRNWKEETTRKNKRHTATSFAHSLWKYFSSSRALWYCTSFANFWISGGGVFWPKSSLHSSSLAGSFCRSSRTNRRTLQKLEWFSMYEMYLHFLPERERHGQKRRGESKKMSSVEINGYRHFSVKREHLSLLGHKTTKPEQQHQFSRKRSITKNEKLQAK